MDGCAKYKEALALKYYGELDGTQEREFDAHLASCASCAREYGRTKAMLDGIGGALGPGSVPQADVQRALRATRERLARRRKARLIPAGLAAAAAAAAIVMALYLPRTNEPARDTQARTAAPAPVTAEDWLAVENYDLVSDLDVIKALDSLEAVEEPV